MSATTIIFIVVAAVLLTSVIVYRLLIHQKKAIMDEFHQLSSRLKEMEMKGQSPPSIPAEELPLQQQPVPTEEAEEQEASPSVQLGSLTDEEMFSYLSQAIRDEEMFRSPDLNRNFVMERFSLSAVRIGNAFARGGGMSLPEFVRNCRLDYACQLMVEQPEMPFTEVSSQSGYQRTTTFYHDFKACFGMPPAEYREKELNKEQGTRAKKPIPNPLP